MVYSIHRHEMAIGIHMSPPSYPPPPPPFHFHPSRLSENPAFEFAASYSKLPLAIYFTYGNLYYLKTSILSVTRGRDIRVGGLADIGEILK